MTCACEYNLFGTVSELCLAAFVCDQRRTSAIFAQARVAGCVWVWVRISRLGEIS